MTALDPALDALTGWFDARGWHVFDFQRETWAAFGEGRSGLLHAPTGMGKTLAAIGGPILEALSEERSGASGLRVLWITPLRALARDSVSALQEVVSGVGLPWTVELRTGDTSSHVKQRQLKRLPEVLVTTPESLSLLLSYKGADTRFRHVSSVVVDEWHELLGSKRGVQTELGLARVDAIAPRARRWGMSATLGNTAQAMEVLLGPCRADDGVMIRGDAEKDVRIETLRPEGTERFPWSGHLGLRLIDQVIASIEGAGTTLVFTNTRSQTEIWFHALQSRRPDWIGAIALHHGSLERDVRNEVERLLGAGRLRCVVCTSSLDLGVDFTPVDQVIQVGSPKGVARMLQRAGRSGHQPGAISRVHGLPTNALELVEFAAARTAAERGDIESRVPVRRPLDVLVQHLVTIALGDGFEPDTLRDEIRATHAYGDITDEEWRWCLDFVERGGPTLEAYPNYARVIDQDGRRIGASQKIARLHRMTIGTITSSAAVTVRYGNGRRLGSVEESFISRLSPGDRFVFGGRVVELVRVRNMSATVRRATARKGLVPRWGGGRSPLSTQLADAVREKLDEAKRGRFDGDEMTLVRPLLELQAAWSVIPGRDELLIEMTRYRRRHHVFLFTLAGRLVNEGLSALIAHRLTRLASRSIDVTGNDWGFELESAASLGLDEAGWRDVLSTEHLVEDLLDCLNSSQLARRHFREVARIAGLIFPGFPGQPKPARHLQASSDLFFDVFQEFDPANMLLDQARREVLDRELEVERLRTTLERLAAQRFVLVETERVTPLAFPMFAETIRQQHVSSEPWGDRIKRMVLELEQAADEG